MKRPEDSCNLLALVLVHRPHTLFPSGVIMVNKIDFGNNMPVLSGDITVGEKEEPTMSSRMIARLTNKEHRNVKRDISKMLSALELDALKFEHIYKDVLGRDQTEYQLNRELTDCLLTGYSHKARIKVIRRWHELEERASVNSERSNFPIPRTYPEALRVAADLAEDNEIKSQQLAAAAPKVAFVDELATKDNLLTASQVGQKHGLSARKLNSILKDFGVYNTNVKRTRVFQQWFIDKGYGEMKQTGNGFDQALFTNRGEIWIHEQLMS